MRPDISARLLLQLDDLTDLYRGANAGLGGRVRHEWRAPGLNALRLIIGLVAPHREQCASQAPGQCDDRDLFPAPPCDRLRPGPKGLGPGMRGAPHTPRGLHEKRLSVRMGAAYDATAALLFAGAVFPRDQAQIAGHLPRSRKPTGRFQRGHERTRGDRANAR